ncbi:MAG: hypothetical protein JWO80_2845 [Bryobacterales bacterium]|nr:hypothetical protein [Bryobacterales bacterium]
MSRESTTLFATQSFALPHRNLSDEINGNVIRSEIEGGVYMDDLDAGDVLVVETRNTNYRLVNHGRGRALISGHPEFCPDPVLVTVEGSNWGGSLLKASFIGRGMCLEFRHPVFQTITTSPILHIRQV